MNTKYLIIGLGNPGKHYSHNRHNAGHLFIDSIQRSGDSSQFIKTDTFMNDSGGFVKKYLSANRYPLDAFYLVHDDLDIPIGKFKIQFGVGPKVHNGVESVEQHLGTKDFWRIRIGVDSRDPENRTSGEQYVLQDFTSEELTILNGVFTQIKDAITQEHFNR